jgi:hypothetical protein
VSAAANPIPTDESGATYEAPQPLTDEEAQAIGDLGNEGDDCGLLAQARTAQRELHLGLISHALSEWERRRRGNSMD